MNNINFDENIDMLPDKPDAVVSQSPSISEGAQLPSIQKQQVQ